MERVEHDATNAIAIRGMWRRRVAWFVITVNLFAGALFLGLFRENLHCTQDTSFWIATFDMDVHVEEEIEQGPPLVYRMAAAIVGERYAALSIFSVMVMVLPFLLLAIGLSIAVSSPAGSPTPPRPRRFPGSEAATG